ncbi:hypothetical protein THASP1DRAFT_24795 [Thamnocephalis sphaerospora]|uniref:LIM zinc-binding domain-containing protein n=1 Tax=Thamnocephalis sphaerospora TaxID=78915 RepID=A0A4P9XM48_9FUNG|nr:hypothetical protein THASP1DRAFT_24795 [Thamnocephalis sphaerospora]|eukprot:RKP06968.1 hypothetical protein THASP1DRAFT_24795 [Thamnocephalis sphaerospora]
MPSLNRTLPPRSTAATLDDLAALVEYSVNHIQVYPYFGVLRPEGTYPDYDMDSHGRIVVIRLLDINGELVRTVKIQRSIAQGRINSIEVANHTQEMSNESISTIVEIFYGEAGRMVAFYSTRTAKGHASVKVVEASRSNDIRVSLAYGQMDKAPDYGSGDSRFESCFCSPHMQRFYTWPRWIDTNEERLQRPADQSREPPGWSLVVGTRYPLPWVTDAYSWLHAVYPCQILDEEQANLPWLTVASRALRNSAAQYTLPPVQRCDVCVEFRQCWSSIFGAASCATSTLSIMTATTATSARMATKITSENAEALLEDVVRSMDKNYCEDSAAKQKGEKAASASKPAPVNVSGASPIHRSRKHDLYRASFSTTAMSVVSMLPAPPNTPRASAVPPLPPMEDVPPPPNRKPPPPPPPPTASNSADATANTFADVSATLDGASVAMSAYEDQSMMSVSSRRAPPNTPRNSLASTARFGRRRAHTTAGNSRRQSRAGSRLLRSASTGKHPSIESLPMADGLERLDETSLCPTPDVTCIMSEAPVALDQQQALKRTDSPMPAGKPRVTITTKATAATMLAGGAMSPRVRAVELSPVPSAMLDEQRVPFHTLLGEPIGTPGNGSLLDHYYESSAHSADVAIAAKNEVNVDGSRTVQPVGLTSHSHSAASSASAGSLTSAGSSASAVSSETVNGASWAAQHSVAAEDQESGVSWDSAKESELERSVKEELLVSSFPSTANSPTMSTLPGATSSNSKSSQSRSPSRRNRPRANTVQSSKPSNELLHGHKRSSSVTSDTGAGHAPDQLVIPSHQSAAKSGRTSELRGLEASVTGAVTAAFFSTSTLNLADSTIQSDSTSSIMRSNWPAPPPAGPQSAPIARAVMDAFSPSMLSISSVDTLGPLLPSTHTPHIYPPPRMSSVAAAAAAADTDEVPLSPIDPLHTSTPMTSILLEKLSVSNKAQCKHLDTYTEGATEDDILDQQCSSETNISAVDAMDEASANPELGPQQWRHQEAQDKCGKWLRDAGTVVRTAEQKVAVVTQQDRAAIRSIHLRPRRVHWADDEAPSVPTAEAETKDEPEEANVAPVMFIPPPRGASLKGEGGIVHKRSASAPAHATSSSSTVNGESATDDVLDSGDAQPKDAQASDTEEASVAPEEECDKPAVVSAEKTPTKKMIKKKKREEGIQEREAKRRAKEEEKQRKQREKEERKREEEERKRREKEEKKRKQQKEGGLLRRKKTSEKQEQPISQPISRPSLEQWSETPSAGSPMNSGCNTPRQLSRPASIASSSGAYASVADVQPAERQLGHSRNPSTDSSIAPPPRRSSRMVPQAIDMTRTASAASSLNSTLQQVPVSAESSPISSPRRGLFGRVRKNTDASTSTAVSSTTTRETASEAAGDSVVQQPGAPSSPVAADSRFATPFFTIVSDTTLSWTSSMQGPNGRRGAPSYCASIMSHTHEAASVPFEGTNPQLELQRARELTLAEARAELEKAAAEALAAAVAQDRSVKRSLRHAKKPNADILATAAMAVPTCACCKEEITSDVCFGALGRYWKVEHFRCKHCRFSFPDGTFVEHAGRAYCPRDYFTLFAPRCHGCHMVIRSGSVRAMDTIWHNDCFCCEDCGKPLQSNAFIEINGLPYCLRDAQNIKRR